MSTPHSEGDLVRDPPSVAAWLIAMRPWVKAWHRSEVRGLENIPEGASLIVSNHSGGTLTTDWPVFVQHFADRFGVDRPLYLLAHSVLFVGKVGELLRRVGILPASPGQAQAVLSSGAALLVFPGGDADASRPTSRRNTIDFDGRTGYVRTALRAGVPIVPLVSVGGQETQLFLGGGRTLTRLTGLDRLTRMSSVPVTIGFPFGLSVLAPNLPLPSKIVSQVLDPIDVRAQFGDEPDPEVVDAHVRAVMQAALDELAGQRRFPVIG